MSEKISGDALNDALNKPKAYLGVHWLVLLGIFGLGMALGIKNIPAGIAVFSALFFVARRICRNDPQILKLWLLYTTQKAHYDPGKRRMSKA